MPYLKVETDDGVRRISLDRDRLTIGRAATNDVVIPRQQVSRHHAEVRSSPEGWWIADLGSTNGVQIDGRRVERRLLRAGDRAQLAPGVRVWLDAGDHADELSAQPTARIPSVALERGALAHGLGGAVARSWLPASSATAWGATRGVVGRSASGSDTGAPVEGDLFRRRRSRVSGAPNPGEASNAPNPAYGATAAHLHLCHTCGQQTAPDSVYCGACGTSIAHECQACRLRLLPVQDVCPRCQTPNPASVLRARQSPLHA